MHEQAWGRVLRMATPFWRIEKHEGGGQARSTASMIAGMLEFPASAGVTLVFGGAATSVPSTSGDGSMLVEHQWESTPSVHRIRESGASQPIGGVAEPAAATPSMAAGVPGAPWGADAASALS